MSTQSSIWHWSAVRHRWVTCLTLPLTVILLAVPTGAAGAAWSVPLPKEANGTLTVAPDTTLFVGSCTDVTRGGGVLWQLPEVAGRTPNCMDAVTDSAGNTYTLTEEGSGHPVVESLNSSGAVRWTESTGGFVSFRTEPVIGANGSVFFSMWNGAYAKVVGYDEQTGAITLEHQFYDVTGLHAYSGGLIVVNTDSQVIYLGYEGTVLSEYSTGPPISAYEAYSNATGADGTLFVAGYKESCGSESHASAEKFTPVGLAWTWTDKAAYCTQTRLTATPDGGVIFARSETNPSAYFTSLSATGSERWTDNMKGPIGPADDAGYFPVRVDVNGVVALPATNIYRCPVQPNEECLGAQVELVSAQTGATVYEPVQLQGSGEYGFDLYGDAIGAERLYVTGEVLEPSATPVLDAFSIPGLGLDYQVALEEQLTGRPSSPPPVASGGSSGGGSGPPTNSGGGGASGPPPPSVNPCVPSHGSLIHELLASIKCTAHELKLEVECGVAVASLLYLPLKSLKFVEAAKSASVIAKLPAKLRPGAKLIYDLSHARFLKHAPPGFRSGPQAVSTISNLKHGYELIEKLPDIAKAISKGELSQIALDLDEVLGLKSCVQAVADGLAG
jgi:hypothetical protein